MIPRMSWDWFARHGATVLILTGGAFSAFSSFKVWWQASGEREKRRVGYWPFMILLGTSVAVAGTVWAGYGQDQLFDYLSGGDSYGVFVPMPVSNQSFRFFLMQQGATPLYDVLVDAIDATKRRKLMGERGLTSENLRSKQYMSAADMDQLWAVDRETTAALNIGNVGPGASRMVWETPIPKDDDQRYEFAMWARNGFVSEVLLMHRNASGWVWAWRVERTLPQVNKGKPRKLDEYVTPGFPPEKLKWVE